MATLHGLHRAEEGVLCVLHQEQHLRLAPLPLRHSVVEGMDSPQIDPTGGGGFPRKTSPAHFLFETPVTYNPERASTQPASQPATLGSEGWVTPGFDESMAVIRDQGRVGVLPQDVHLRLHPRQRVRLGGRLKPQRAMNAPRRPSPRTAVQVLGAQVGIRGGGLGTPVSFLSFETRNAYKIFLKQNSKVE